MVGQEDPLPPPVKVKDCPLGLFPRLVKVKGRIERLVLFQKAAMAFGINRGYSQ